MNDKVCLRVPKLDKFGTELSRLPCKIIEKFGKVNINYKLATSYGIINASFRAVDLMPYHGLLEINTERKLPVREAFRLFSERDRSKIDISKISCKCSNKCFQDKRCKCFINKVKCTSHCQNGLYFRKTACRF